MRIHVHVLRIYHMLLYIHTFLLTWQSSSIINLIAKSSDQLHLEHVACIRKSDQQRKLQESQAIGGTFVGLINHTIVPIYIRIDSGSNIIL